MSAWLVVDLRAGRVAAGLFSAGWPALSWAPLTLTVHVSPGTRDSVTETSLALYREPGNQAWSPIPRENLADLDPADYEMMEYPLQAPMETQQKILPAVLNGMLKTDMTNYPEIPVLVIVDRMETLQALGVLIERWAGSRSGTRASLVSPRPAGSLAGYACLDPQASIVPERGAAITCALSDGTGQPKLAGWSWQPPVFLPSPQPDGAPALQFDMTESQMETAGAALFCLHWQSRMAGLLAASLAAQRAALAHKQELAARMKRMVERLAQSMSLAH